MLLHPACSQLVVRHMEDLAQKVVLQCLGPLTKAHAMLTIARQDSVHMCISRRISNHSLS